MKQTRTFDADIRVLHAVVIATTHLGGPKRTALLQVLAEPTGDSMKNAVKLLVDEYERTDLRLGKDSLARVRRVVEYLSVPELKDLLGGLCKRRAISADIPDDVEDLSLVESES